MIMILFQSPARWNLHVVAALVGELGEGSGWEGGWVVGRLVKAAEQIGKAINSGCVCVQMNGEAVCKVLIHAPTKNQQNVSDFTCGAA